MIFKAKINRNGKRMIIFPLPDRKKVKGIPDGEQRCRTERSYDEDE